MDTLTHDWWSWLSMFSLTAHCWCTCQHVACVSHMHVHIPFVVVQLHQLRDLCQLSTAKIGCFQPSQLPNMALPCTYNVLHLYTCLCMYMYVVDL